MFEQFDRLDIDKKTTIEGTGLGLAITKKLVSMMGGTINVSSVYGKGSIFVVNITQTISKMTKPEDETVEETIIPDEVTILASLIIILTNFVGMGLGKGLIQLGSGFLAFGVMYSIMLIGNAIFKKETLGGADIKLMFLAGLTLHPILGILVIFVASCIALPVSLIIYMTDKEHIIPFGPFLAAAMVLMYFMKIDIDVFLSLFV